MCERTIPKKPPLSEDAIQAQWQRLERVLREHGYAVTARRKAVYDVLLQTNDHVCAEHLLEEVSRKNPQWRVNKTTIYRTLDLLKALGLIYEMKRDDGSTQYELDLHGPHGHLLCSKCGALQDLDWATAAALERAIEAGCGFHLDLASHALPGICSECAEAGVR